MQYKGGRQCCNSKERLLPLVALRGQRRGTARASVGRSYHPQQAPSLRGYVCVRVCVRVRPMSIPVRWRNTSLQSKQRATTRTHPQKLIRTPHTEHHEIHNNKRYSSGYTPSSERAEAVYTVPSFTLGHSPCTPQPSEQDCVAHSTSFSDVACAMYCSGEGGEGGEELRRRKCK